MIRVIKFYNTVVDLVVAVSKLITTMAVPFLLIYTLYFMWYFDLKRAIIGGAISLVFTRVNILLNGGDLSWKNRTSRLR